MDPYTALINMLSSNICPDGMKQCEDKRDQRRCRSCWCQFAEELAREV